MRSAVSLLLLLLFTTQAKSADEFAIEGIMHHTDLEGGCWYLDGGGKKYELRAGDEILDRTRVEGKYLKLLVRSSGGASICMVGQIVEVLAVLDTVRHPVDEQILHLRVTGKMRKHARGCWYVRTAKGLTYELEGTVPKRWRKVGARFNERVRVIRGSHGKCGLKWVIVGLDTPTKAKEQPRADPR